ncbi:MAG: lamin tail domain-containing protein [candidate division KSB1 bacterium]|nr:lamin tail domain-containing protein [candidate division KSB1 bacterium]
MKSILFCLLFTAASHSQIVLSEIMFNPKGDERTLEYIELFNKSKTTSLSLKNHMLTDGQGVDQITTVTGELSLQPEQFALVLSPTYYEKSTAYDSIVPPETLWLTIHNSQFGAYGLNNSKGEPVSLLSPDSSVLSSYTYTVDNDDGISDEKIDLYGSDAADNWGNSQPGGTPGFLNSISPASHDLSLEYIDHFPAPCSDQDSVTILILLTNKGLHAIEYIDLIVEIRSDTTEPHGSPIYQSRLTNRIPISDSVRNTIKLSPFEPGRYDLKIKANTEKDDRLSNNSINLKLLCYPLFSPKDILINEIYFDPAPDSSEWVELYNNSGQTINLCNWTFSDSRTRIRVQRVYNFYPVNIFCLAPLHLTGTV